MILSGKLTFSLAEVRDLFFSTLILSFVFSFSAVFNTYLEVFVNFFITFMFIGVSFLIHELAHKIGAEYFGADSVYKIWPLGLLIAILVGILSNGALIFFVPGIAVFSAYPKKRFGTGRVILDLDEDALISLSGPLASLLMVLLFKFFSPILPYNIWQPMVIINSWIALFSLIPWTPFDGGRIFFYNWLLWGIFFGISCASAFFGVVAPIGLFVLLVIAMIITAVVLAVKYNLY